MTDRALTDHPSQPILELRSITKRFGRVVACDDVSLRVAPGEIRGLLGQNGAGKSTLMKIVSGVVKPDGGEILIRGDVAHIDNPLDAASYGVGMVHQDFSLIGPLPVWKNVTLGERGRVDAKRTVAEIKRISERFGLYVDPYARVEDLTISQRQRVEIVKCLRRDPGIVILDEPTSVLTLAESKALFDVLRELIREADRAVVLISHRLEEMLDAADEITILRDGAVISNVVASDVTPSYLAGEMLGRPMSLAFEAPAAGLPDNTARDGQSGAFLVDRGRDSLAAGSEIPALALEDVVHVTRDGRVALDGLSLSVAKGEILGVAGVEGNGQAALVDLLSNLIRSASGRVVVDGKDVEVGKGRSLLQAGVGVIPADRHDSGCILDMTVAENLALNKLDTVIYRGLLNSNRLYGDAARLVHDFDIMASSLSAPLRSLSGGNQQRVVLAREVSSTPNVLVAAEPTHGLDVGAMKYMWTRLRDATAAGTAVLLVSSDLDEILALADRIVVINRGRIVGEMLRAEVDLEQLGLLMGSRPA